MGICSLNPNVDRLTQSAIMEIDPHGKVNIPLPNGDQYNLPVAYSDVNDILAGDEERLKPLKKIVPSIHQMATLHGILESMRIRRGALNFDL